MRFSIYAIALWAAGVLAQQPVTLKHEGTPTGENKTINGSK
jgi:hypothetical protein